VAEIIQTISQACTEYGTIEKVRAEKDAWNGKTEESNDKLVFTCKMEILKVENFWLIMRRLRG